jgi:photosystem II stability/assembly factor-like uncharacterized protein
MRIIKIVLGFIILFCQPTLAQTSIKLLTEKKGVSIRGLAVPSENVIWASGSKGSIALSKDGGASFNWMQVAGYETRDFRAIHAWNSNEAVIVAVSAPAIILKTIDGGITWNKVYENKDTSMFLDAIAFINTKEGFVIGDPIKDTIFLLNTKDGGTHWERVKSNFWKSKVAEGEAFFASSNSNLTFLKDELLFVSGGIKSRLWINGNAMPLLMMEGGKSTGANSIAVSPDHQQIVIVGGDFMKDSLTADIARSFMKYDDKFVINTAFSMPNGYKSSVAFLSNDQLIACGTSGVDFSNNKGKQWNRVSPLSFHVVKLIPNTRSAILAGSAGRIALVKFE